MFFLGHSIITVIQWFRTSSLSPCVRAFIKDKHYKSRGKRNDTYDRETPFNILLTYICSEQLNDTDKDNGAYKKHENSAKNGSKKIAHSSFIIMRLVKNQYYRYNKGQLLQICYWPFIQLSQNNDLEDTQESLFHNGLLGD